MILFLSNLNFKATEKDIHEFFKGIQVQGVEFIADRAHEGKHQGKARVELSDADARKALDSLNGRQMLGRGVKIFEDRNQHPLRKNGAGVGSQPARPCEGRPSVLGSPRQADAVQRQRGMQEARPYVFLSRENSGRAGKMAPEAMHDRLLDTRYDIAFEVAWTLETPTAANPARLDDEVRKTAPHFEGYQNQGYDHGWQTTPDGRPVISPFTVKSAVANGFAALLGGCYRVVDRAIPHKSIEHGTFPYDGAWKRYRVAMTGDSKPGVIKSIVVLADGAREVEIQPVQEFYYDGSIDPAVLKNLRQGSSCFAAVVPPRENNGRREYKKFLKTGSVSLAQTSSSPDAVIYHGPYRFGMNCSLGPGELGKRHTHRFFRPQGKTISGVLRRENFLSLREQMEVVNLGKFEKLLPDSNMKDLRSDQGPWPEGVWYEDLRGLTAGDFVYYQNFDGRVTNVGKNYLFRALFKHEDTVPEGSEACTSVKALCPRCRMFGMTEKGGQDEQGATGFKGRFKSAGLVCDNRFASASSHVGQFKTDPGFRPVLWSWQDENGKEMASHVLLPVSGPPKPSKRDNNAYYDKENGRLKGAKTYRHGRLSSPEELEALAMAQGSAKDEEETSSFRLRPFAQVMNPGRTFRGVLGAENCDAEEIAALLVLLEHSIAGHGFKIGLGKAFGMGSVTSRITGFWVRRAGDYAWARTQVEEKGVLDAIEPQAPDVEGYVRRLEQAHKAVLKFQEGALPRLRYPEKGKFYWKDMWAGT